MDPMTTMIRGAARVAVLCDLQEEGLLQGLTLQRIADLVGGGTHRSTIMRILRHAKLYRAEVMRLREVLAPQLEEIQGP